MIIVISPATIIAKETELVNDMLGNGLDLFHIRKYELEDSLVIKYLEAIHPNFRNKIVLQSHKHLAEKMEISRLHFNTMDRNNMSDFVNFQGMCLSTSTHSIEEFNHLDGYWNYAFLSPAYKSISKLGYGKYNTVLSDFQFKQNDAVQLIGLGGIRYQNMEQVYNYGADGIALMGAIWNESNPVEYLSACKQKEIMWKGKQYG